jgi:hypothetical protein
LKLGGCYGVPPLAEGCREPSLGKPSLVPAGFHPHAFSRAGLRAPLAFQFKCINCVGWMKIKSIVAGMFDHRWRGWPQDNESAKTVLSSYRRKFGEFDSFETGQPA